MNSVVSLADIDIQISRKDIKNVHLSVLPPNGRVAISAPKRLSDDLLRTYALSRLGWIRKQQALFESQRRETPREYLFLESHYVWGHRYLLEIEPNARETCVELLHDKIKVKLYGDYSQSKAESVLYRWYRQIIREKTELIMTKWSKALGVKPNKLIVSRMKTKWGACNPSSRNIRLNSELAKKPLECLEFILVHELVHLIEPTHNDNFRAVLSKHLPTWKARRELLNSKPLAHEDWKY